MRERLRGSYRGRRQDAERPIQPVLALAGEGKTEVHYSRWAGRRSYYRVRPKQFKGHHGKQLIDDALTYAAEQRRQFADAEVVPAVLYDLESQSSKNIQIAQEAVEYANAKGVRVWISTPAIERWFLLHYMNFSPNRSVSVAAKMLAQHMQMLRRPNYNKPGSERFYSELTLHTLEATSRCKKSHLADVNLPCICEFVAFLRKRP